jgi:hypothetical protein
LTSATPRGELIADAWNSAAELDDSNEMSAARTIGGG